MLQCEIFSISVIGFEKYVHQRGSLHFNTTRVLAGREFKKFLIDDGGHSKLLKLTTSRNIFDRILGILQKIYAKMR